MNENQSNISLSHLVDHASSNQPSVLPFFMLLIVVFILSIIFNSVSIASIFTAKKFTPINILITNLAFADVTYTFGIPFFLFQLFNFNLPFGSFGCKLFMFTEFSGIIVGILTVSALSFERFINVAESKSKSKCLNYLSNHKLLFSIIYSLVTWLVSFCFSVPLIRSIKPNCQSDWQDSTLTMFFMLKFLIIFIVPYLFIIVSSVKLLIFLNQWKKNLKSRHVPKPLEPKISDPNKLLKLKKSKHLTTYLQLEEKKKSNPPCQTGSFKSLKSKKSSYIDSIQRKASRLVLIILLLFIAQWSPFWIFQILMLLSSQANQMENIQFINVAVSTLSYTNTVANPALYMLFTYNFKENSKKMFNKFMRK